MILCLNNDIYPMIGHIALDQINVDDVRRVIWRKKDQGYDASANQVRGLLKRMLDYAMTLCNTMSFKQSHHGIFIKQYLEIDI